MSFPSSDYNICKVCLQSLPSQLNQAFRANELCSDRCMNQYLLSNTNIPLQPKKLSFKEIKVVSKDSNSIVDKKVKKIANYSTLNK